MRFDISYVRRFSFPIRAHYGRSTRQTKANEVNKATHTATSGKEHSQVETEKHLRQTVLSEEELKAVEKLRTDLVNKANAVGFRRFNDIWVRGCASCCERYEDLAARLATPDATNWELRDRITFLVRQSYATHIPGAAGNSVGGYATPATREAAKQELHALLDQHRNPCTEDCDSAAAELVASEAKLAAAAYNAQADYTWIDFVGHVGLERLDFDITAATEDLRREVLVRIDNLREAVDAFRGVIERRAFGTGNKDKASPFYQVRSTVRDALAAVEECQILAANNEARMQLREIADFVREQIQAVRRVASLPVETCNRIAAGLERNRPASLHMDADSFGNGHGHALPGISAVERAEMLRDQVLQGLGTMMRLADMTDDREAVLGRIEAKRQEAEAAFATLAEQATTPVAAEQIAQIREHAQRVADRHMRELQEAEQALEQAEAAAQEPPAQAPEATAPAAPAATQAAEPATVTAAPASKRSAMLEWD